MEDSYMKKMVLFMRSVGYAGGRLVIDCTLIL